MLTRLAARRLLSKLFAALVVCIIFADIALDGSCDPVATGGATQVAFTAGTTDGANDPCADLCVPDCFCCSRSVTAGPAILPPMIGPVAAASELRAPATPAGVRPVPYHPPLLLV